MKTFIFGGDDLPKTPQELARLRATAEALAPSRAPQNVGEGIASIGNAIVYRALMGKADKAQKSGADAASKRYDSVFKALISGGPASAPASGATESARSADRSSMPGYSSPQESMASVSPTNDPVADVLAAGKTGASGDAPSWLSYANQHATRSQPLDPKLVTALGFLPDMGVSMEVFSGGQPEAGQGPRTGSVRHDHGGAADAFFYKDGRKLDWSNPADRPIFEEIVRRGKAAGITGFGAGDGYMQPGSMHLGFGTPAVWGAGGKGANAPDWLRNAYAGEGPSPAAMAAQPGMAASASASPALGYAPQQPVEVASVGQQVPDMALRAGGDAPPPAMADQGKGWMRALTGMSGQEQGASGQFPSAPGIQVAQTAPLGNGFDLNAAIELANDPYLPEGKKAVLQALIGQQLEQQQAQREMEMKRSDPMYKLDLETKQAQLDKLRNPVTAKPADVQEYEYAKSQGYDGSFLDFQLAQKKAGASQVNIDQKTEGEFDKELAKKQAATLDTMAAEGMNARSELGVIDQLDGLLAGQGGTLTGMSGVLARYGIGGENVSDLQAADALINKLIPSQRAPGSGSMSDRDVEMFRASLPSLWNTPGGNQIILGTMRGLAQYKQAQGDIAQRVMIGEIDRKEAIKMLRELPNPLEEFRKMKPSSKTEAPQAKQPVVIDGYTIEEVQ